MFKGPNKETKHTLLPLSMLLLKKEIERLESKDRDNSENLSLRLYKTEYEILKRLNMDTNISCIGKTIEEEHFNIQHSILILDSPATVDTYTKVIENLDQILQPLLKENQDDKKR